MRRSLGFRVKHRTREEGGGEEELLEPSVVCAGGHVGPFPGDEEGFGLFAGAFEASDQGRRSPSCQSPWDVELWFLGQIWRRERQVGPQTWRQGALVDTSVMCSVPGGQALSHPLADLVKSKSCSVVSDSLPPPWTVACQAPLGFLRQEYWSR